MTTLISGLTHPIGVAVDASGNLYMADTMIRKWDAATQQVTVLAPNTGTNDFSSVAVDGQGNVYIADSAQNAIDEWTAATQQLTTLVSSRDESAERNSRGCAGEHYIADTYNSTIERWPSTQQMATLRDACE